MFPKSMLTSDFLILSLAYPLLSLTRISEVDFWRNLFYRISLIKQAVQISSANKGCLIVFQCIVSLLYN